MIVGRPQLEQVVVVEGDGPRGAPADEAADADEAANADEERLEALSEETQPPLFDLRAWAGYAKWFNLFAAFVFCASASWSGSFPLAVLPALRHGQGTEACDGRTGPLQPAYAILAFGYLVCFTLARALLCLPCVAARVSLLLQPEGSRACGGWVVCGFRVVFDGPAYNLMVCVMIFGVLAMSSFGKEARQCGQLPFAIWALSGFAMSALWSLCMCWQNMLLADAAFDLREPEKPSAEQLEATLEDRPFDEHIFGDEEGKLFPSACYICLAAWEPSDIIKITPCRHAFHEECIRPWLRTARTCAVCRQDLLSAPLERAARQALAEGHHQEAGAEGRAQDPPSAPAEIAPQPVTIEGHP